MEQQTMEIRICGIVQGVGFRPFVYRLAQRFSLRGSVSNTGAGVLIRAAGSRKNISRFMHSLEHDAPPLAAISSMKRSVLAEPIEEKNFVILSSRADGQAVTLISPDISICDDCLKEILDPADRRYRYPFTNCTNCGPRLTIISGLPYDRSLTSMAGFRLCKQCRQEYEDPENRRFHAQPNGCPICGPSLSLHDATGQKMFTQDCINAAACSLRDGKILALKGLGGFHLCVDAKNAQAVNRLRTRKQRYAKPLAIMVRDCETARTYGFLTDRDEVILASRQRPIVLVRKRESGKLSAEVSPKINEVGIMLPYTPLHYLLLNQAETPESLVMTSGNRSHEPICTRNDEALTRLAGIADLFLLHNRTIVTRVDDSVVRTVQGKTQTIRRSRGSVPLPVVLPKKTPHLLACGAELKNTFCLARDCQAFPGPHIGNLTGPKTLAFYEESIEHFQDICLVKPQVVICDRHPDYLSTLFARNYAAKFGLPLLQVQHHHAHAAAVMAEHGLFDVLAVIFDGAGLGPDNTIWGGEFLRVNEQGLHRIGHIRRFPLPGGDRAAREPWRVAVALCRESYKQICPSDLQRKWPGIPADHITFLLKMMDTATHSPLTSSCGRLFDGIAALIGLRSHARYEGQAAMELEGLAWQVAPEHPDQCSRADQPRYEISLVYQQQTATVDFRPMVRQVIRDIARDVETALIAYAFHHWLADSSCLLLHHYVKQQDIQTVVLSGGCMQNRLLLRLFFNLLERNGFAVYTGEKIAVNDGGIALGQVFIGGQVHVSGNPHAST